MNIEFEYSYANGIATLIGFPVSSQSHNRLIAHRSLRDNLNDYFNFVKNNPFSLSEEGKMYRRRLLIKLGLGEKYGHTHNVPLGSFIAYDSNGEQVDLPTDDTVELDPDGHIYLNSYRNGIVKWNNVKKVYVHTYHHTNTELDIVKIDICEL